MKALKILLRNKRLMVSCYNPDKQLPSVDFSTGAQAKTNTITFTEGAILNSKEVRSFVKEGIITGTNIAFLLMENPRTDIDLATRFVVSGVTYNTKRVFDSFYAKWVLVAMERSTSEQALSAEAQAVYASDRTTAYVDWLINETKKIFPEIPEDLILWPLVGFTTAESMKHIYPSGGYTEYSGSVDFKEIGRTSGYSGTGLVDGSAPKRATAYPQTNYPELNGIVDQFNTLMGRL